MSKSSSRTILEVLCALLIVGIVLLVRLCGADAIDYPASAEAVAHADSAMVDTVDRAVDKMEREIDHEKKGKIKERELGERTKAKGFRVRQPLDEPVRDKLD